MTAPPQPPMSLAPRLTVRVAACPAGIADAAAALDRFRQEHDLGDRAAWPLPVALDEILSNIVRHGQPGSGARVIELAVRLLDDGVEMSVSDDGPAFDPLGVPEPDVAGGIEERRPGGLGVHLVRNLMEKTEYTRAAGRNRLVMTWRPQPPPQRGGRSE